MIDLTPKKIVVMDDIENEQDKAVRWALEFNATEISDEDVEKLAERLVEEWGAQLDDFLFRVRQAYTNPIDVLYAELVANADPRTPEQIAAIRDGVSSPAWWDSIQPIEL